MEPGCKLFAGVLGLTAFLVASVTGLLAGIPADTVLARAVVSMFICYFVGALLGKAAGHAVCEFVSRYREENPVTDLRTVAAEYEVGPER